MLRGGGMLLGGGRSLYRLLGEKKDADRVGGGTNAQGRGYGTWGGGEITVHVTRSGEGWIQNKLRNHIER